MFQDLKYPTARAFSKTLVIGEKNTVFKKKINGGWDELRVALKHM